MLLTKIVENGEELCHKYWPEEGSQLYHIYEVDPNIYKFIACHSFDHPCIIGPFGERTHLVR